MRWRSMLPNHSAELHEESQWIGLFVSFGWPPAHKKQGFGAARKGYHLLDVNSY
jgi:hypothetical protein